MLRGKCLSWLKKKRSIAEPAEEALATPPVRIEPASSVLEPCPATEDFNNEITGLLNVDTIEGCRVNLTRTLTTPQGELGGMLMLNYGTYQSFSNQNELLKALLHNQVGPKGGRNWATALKFATLNQKHSIHGRYMSKTGSKELRLMSRPSPMSLIRFNGITPSLSEAVSMCREWLAAPRTAVARPGVLSACLAAEHGNENYNVCANAAYQDAVVASAGFATRFLRRWWGGSHLTYISPNGACLVNYYLRFKPDDRTVATGGLNISPNFEKPAAEGISERVFTARFSGIRKLTEVWTVGGEAEVCVNDLKNSAAKIGYECSFPSGRVHGSISSALVVEQSVQDSSGLQLGGSVDFLNDDYKVGFGLNLNE